MLFNVTTAQALSLKASFDALVYAHINESNLVVNKSGLTVTEIDPSHALVVRLLLEKQSFQIFEVQEEVVVGISIKELARLFKNVSNKDTVTLCMDAQNPTQLQIVVYRDGDSCITHRLKTLLLPYEKIDIPFREVDRVINMPSSDFARYIKEFSNNRFIELHITQDHVFFIRVKTDLCTSEVEIQTRSTSTTTTTTTTKIVPKPSANGSVIGNTATTIGLGRNGNWEVRQTFPTKFLTAITKNSNIDEQITLYMTKGQALMARFNVSIIGTLVYILAPEEEDDDDDNDNDDDMSSDDDE